MTISDTTKPLTYTEWRDGQDVTVTIERQDFPQMHQLHYFLFEEGEFRCHFCFERFDPQNLGDAIDWALGHDCV